MFEEITSTTLFLYLIVLLLSIISVTLVVLLVYSGLFSSVKEVGTGKPPLGKVVIAYKFEKGPYNAAGQIFTEAHMIAPDNKCVGIYYDDPRKVPSRDLRYAVGSILASDPSDVDEEVLNRFTQKQYKVMTLPEVEFAVTTSFPHVTTLSILIAIQKAYPKMAQYIEERKLCAHPFLEYYDGKDIHFLAPLSKQEEFWVSECHEGGGDVTEEDADVNTTLDTSHSVLEESMEESSVNASPSMKTTPEESQFVAETAKDANTPSEDEREDGVGNEMADNEDNSSSSSFEVLKNEPVE